MRPRLREADGTRRAFRCYGCKKSEYPRPTRPSFFAPLEMDSDDVVRVGKTRITLDIIIAFTDGATAEGIAQQYPSFQLAAIYFVIGYYLRHRAEVDAYLRQRAQQASHVHQLNDARFDPSGIRDRLLARRASQSR